MKVIYFKVIGFISGETINCFECNYEASDNGNYRTIDRYGDEGWVMPNIIAVVELGGNVYWKPITKEQFEWESIK